MTPQFEWSTVGGDVGYKYYEVTNDQGSINEYIYLKGYENKDKIIEDNDESSLGEN